ncbi:MAG: hypothetical protein ACUVT7_00425 [Thermoplasmata archaeon]
MEAKRNPGRTMASLTRDRILEAELSWISGLVLFYSTVYLVLKLDILWVVFGITALSLYVLPIVAARDPFRALPWEMTIVLSLPILLHLSEGSRALRETAAWWDNLTSLAFAFSMSTIGFLLVIELRMFTSVRMNRPFAVFFVIMFTLAVSGFWQVGEYIGDVFFGTQNQTTNGAAMGTMLWSLIGGVAMGIVYDVYLRSMSAKRQKALGLVSLWEESG